MKESVKIEKISALLIDLKNGNKNVLIELYNFMNAEMTFFAGIYLYDKNLIQDVIQDAIMNINKYINTFNDNKNSINWIIKIVKNAAIKYNNSWQTQNIYDIDNYTLGYNDMIEEKFTINNAIISLNEEEKKLFIQYFVNEYTIREIARMDSMSKTKVSKNIIKLKNKFNRNIYINLINK